MATSLPPGDCAGFSLDFAPGVVGQASAVEAAQWFAAHGGEPGYPSSDWQPVGQDEPGVSLTSGAAKLHVVHLPNKTWIVDQGWRC